MIRKTKRHEKLEEDSKRLEIKLRQEQTALRLRMDKLERLTDNLECQRIKTAIVREELGRSHTKEDYLCEVDIFEVLICQTWDKYLNEE